MFPRGQETVQGETGARGMAEARASSAVCECHSFPDMEELEQFRSNLLSWYDAQKRDLPWRTLVRLERGRLPTNGG